MERLLELIKMFLTEHGRMKTYRKILSAMMAVVVFTTTYALILPAITLDAQEAAAQPGIEAEAAPAAEEPAAEEPAPSEPAQSEAIAEDAEEEPEPAVDPTPEESSQPEETAQESELSQPEQAQTDPKQTDDLPAEEVQEEALQDMQDDLDAQETAETEEADLITGPTTLTYDGGDYLVTASFDASAKFPQGVEMLVTEIRSEVPKAEHRKDQKAAREEEEAYQAYYDQALTTVRETQSEQKVLSQARFFDITFVKDGVPYEPQAPIDVKFTYGNLKKNDEKLPSKEETVTVLHFDEKEASFAEVDSDSEVSRRKDAVDINFASDSFSVYGIVYTVDFHWEVDGQTFDYSIDGGDAIALSDLIRVLHILDTDKVSSNYAAYAVANGAALTDTFDDEDILKAFLCDITDVTFSDDTLVRVDRVSGEGSSETPDWTLTSLQPFETEESLTISTKTGETFRIAVTDAQIQKDFITASGETYTITLTYDGTAGIPDDADLQVREIEAGTEEYVKYLQQSAQRLNLVSKDVSFARFFDIEILDGNGEKIEPKTPVQVEIAYKDSVSVREEETLHVVHFLEHGTEVITDVLLSDDQKEISYTQDSFSVTGTVIGSTPANGENQYMILVKDGSRYFIVNNDGTLTEVGYENGTVSVADPMLWTVDGTGNNRHIYFHSEATGFGTNQLASDFYRRYLDPSAAQATTEENASTVTVTDGTPPTWTDTQGNTIHNNYVSNRNTVLNQTSVGVNNGQISHGNQYLAIERDAAGTPVRLVGQSSAANAAQFEFATASKVPDGVHLQNAVNHIDISIEGDAEAKIPLAYGTYYYADGTKRVITTNTKVTLKKQNAVNQDDLKITAEDMKRATIAAFDKNGDELDDAFYITGFSQNASTNLSTAQVRIEGSFKVAQPEKDNPAYETIDGNRYDGNWWNWQMPDNNYVNAVRRARLNNIIEYKLTIVKPVTYYLVDEEGKQLFDSEGEPIEVTVDIAFSGSFNYWDHGKTSKNSGNECPPLENNYAWQQGDIPNHDLSGMDFVLYGNLDDADSPLTALEVTKIIMDEKGNIIHPSMPVTNTIDIYKNKDADPNGVKDYKIDKEGVDNPKRDDDTGIYDGYEPLHSRNITVDSDGMEMIYDYGVTDGMYYIEERHSEEDLPETITDTENNEWRYVKTYIETEYVRRGYIFDDASHDPMHVSDFYTRADEHYKSSPEVLGWFETVDNQVKKSAFLEFYVYNIYTRGKLLEVDKKWELPQGETVPAGAEVTVELYYAKSETNEFPASKDDYEKVIPGTGPFAQDLTTTVVLSADNQWKDSFADLPETMTEGGKTYNLDYYAKEVSVTIPGSGEERVDITAGYTSTSEFTNGVEVITNKLETADLDAEKAWAEGTEIPDGAEVTFDLCYAVRPAADAEGALIPESDREAWPANKNTYARVKPESGYAEIFRGDPRFDENKIITKMQLSKQDAEDGVWKGVFRNLPKYLLGTDGKLYEADYYAVETAVKIPAAGRTEVDGDAVDVTGEYFDTTEQQTGSEGTFGTITITNKKNVTRLDVEKKWEKGTVIPDGAEVAAELRYAARKIRKADGTAEEPAAWPDKEEYQPVRSGETFAELFAAQDETITSKITTSVTLKADTEHPENNWNASFENLPKYLRDAEGNVWELDYHAVEIAVNVPAAEGEGKQNKIGDYIHTEEKTEPSGSDAETSDGSVKITNKEDVVVHVEKKWKPEKPTGAEAVVQLKRYKVEQQPEEIKTEATIVKIWDDENNQDGKRPASLEVTLRGGTANEKVTLNAENSWKATVTDLQEYDDNGDPITYTWTEGDMPDGYALTSSVTRGTVTTMTNSYTPGKTAATVHLTWTDGDNRDALRPEQVTVKLINNGQNVVLNAENNWTATLDGLPEYQNGQKVDYTWYAPALGDYTLSNQHEEGSQQTELTYTHEPEKIEKKVRIVWDDADNQDNLRPESEDVHLFSKNQEVASVNLTPSDWEGTISNLWKNENGQPIIYSWRAPAIAGYTLTSEETDADGTLVLTYHHEPKPPKDYVTVTVHTVLRDARTGYYTNWETNGWNTNLYNVTGTFEGQPFNKNKYTNQQTLETSGPLSFNVDKNTNVSFHYEVGGTSVELVDIGANGSTINRTGSATSGDASFTCGTDDVDVYVVLKGEEVKLPEESTVYMGVSNSGPTAFSKDPTNAVRSITVPVNTDVAFDYDAFYYQPWNQNVDPKYKVYYWHEKQYNPGWEEVTPSVSGENAPDDYVSFNVGMNERYLILIDAGSQFADQLNCRLISQNNNTNSVNAIRPKMVMTARKSASDTNVSNDDSFNKGITIKEMQEKLRAATASAIPSGYIEDTEFNSPAVTLTLNDEDGWSRDFDPQDKYDKWGREYIYYVEEVSHTPADFETESITGNQTEGFVITNAKEQKGGLTITKAVTVNGDAVPDNAKTVADGTYTFTITGPNGYSAEESIKVTNGAVESSIVLTDLSAGEYTIKETGSTNPYITLAQDQTLTVEAGEEASANVAAFTNNLETTQLEVEKKWSDQDEKDHSGDSVTYTLYRYPAAGETRYDPEEVTSATGYTGQLNAGNHWKETITNLPKNGKYTPNGGTKIDVRYTYYVSEGTFDGYKSSTSTVVEDDGSYSVLIINEPVGSVDKPTEVNVEKEWLDEEGEDSKNRHADDTITFRVTQKKYRATTDKAKTGQDASYYIRPVIISLIDGDMSRSTQSRVIYVPSGAVVTIKTAGSGKVRAHGFNKDDNKEKDISGATFKTGNVSGIKEVTLTLSDRDAKWGTSNRISGITATHGGKSCAVYSDDTILNYVDLSPNKQVASETKVYDYSMRINAETGKTVVTPLENAIGTCSGADIWKGTVGNLPFIEGSGVSDPSLYIYTYEISEIRIGSETVQTTDPAEGYNGQTSLFKVKWEQDTQTGTWTITNTEKPRTTADVTKAWKNAKDLDMDAPADATVEVELYADGTATGKKVILNGKPDVEALSDDETVAATQELLSESGNNPKAYESEAWKAVWTDLPKYKEDGTTEIVYTIKENNGPEGFIVSYGDDQQEMAANHGTITNKQKAYELNLVKVEKGKATKKLKDAEFTIRKLVADNAEKIEADTSFEEVTVKTLADGTAKFDTLTVGIYEIEETKVPEGYVLSNFSGKAYILVETSGIKLLKSEAGKAPKDWAELPNTDPSKEYLELEAVTLTVSNTPGAALPSTGGPGTTLYTILGTLLAGFAGVILLLRKHGQIWEI